MPKICYVPRKFARSSQTVIDQANEIITNYAAQGFDLTLRQLYYQFVSRALIPNADCEYKRLGSIVNDARLAGLIDWDALVDRTRNLQRLGHWDTPADVVGAALSGYHVDYWAGQTYRPEVWIEKDALIGVIEGVCNELDVPFFSCRGYTSQSEMWAAGQRLRRYRRAGQSPMILHLGDHDPSGKDMTRDILDRLEMFTGNVPVERLALNMDQVEQYNPPPNPAKLSDSRAPDYVAEFGDSSWELDALEPQVLSDLIRDAIYGVRDVDTYQTVIEREGRDKAVLQRVVTRWDDVASFLEEDGDEDE